jgi:hypothetical protein
MCRILVSVAAEGSGAKCSCVVCWDGNAVSRSCYMEHEAVARLHKEYDTPDSGY